MEGSLRYTKSHHTFEEFAVVAMRNPKQLYPAFWLASCFLIQVSKKWFDYMMGIIILANAVSVSWTQRDFQGSTLGGCTSGCWGTR